MNLKCIDVDGCILQRHDRQSDIGKLFQERNFLECLLVLDLPLLHKRDPNGYRATKEALNVDTLDAIFSLHQLNLLLRVVIIILFREALDICVSLLAIDELTHVQSILLFRNNRQAIFICLSWSILLKKLTIPDDSDQTLTALYALMYLRKNVVTSRVACLLLSLWGSIIEALDRATATSGKDLVDLRLPIVQICRLMLNCVLVLREEVCFVVRIILLVFTLITGIMFIEEGSPAPSRDLSGWHTDLFDIG